MAEGDRGGQRSTSWPRHHCFHAKRVAYSVTSCQASSHSYKLHALHQAPLEPSRGTSAAPVDRGMYFLYCHAIRSPSAASPPDDLLLSLILFSCKPASNRQDFRDRRRRIVGKRWIVIHLGFVLVAAQRAHGTPGSYSDITWSVSRRWK